MIYDFLDYVIIICLHGDTFAQNPEGITMRRLYLLQRIGLVPQPAARYDHEDHCHNPKGDEVDPP